MGCRTFDMQESTRSSFESESENVFASKDISWQDSFAEASSDQVAPCAWSEERQAGALALIRTYGGDESLVKPETIEVLGDIGEYTFCRFLLGGDCASITETYGGCTVLSGCIGYPSATRLYLVGDTRIYTLQQAYVQGIVTDMKAVYDRLPVDMPADYDPTAEDSYLDMDPMGCFTWE